MPIDTDNLLRKRIADLEDHLARETRSSQAANARAKELERELRDTREFVERATKAENELQRQREAIARVISMMTPLAE